MIVRLVDALFALRYPRHYAGRHRLRLRLRELVPGRSARGG